MLGRGVPVSVPVAPPVPSADGVHLYERERADAAEASVAELEYRLRESEALSLERRREPVQARSALNGLRATFESDRGKPAAPRAGLKALHRSRSARNVRRLEKEAARLEALLREAGIDGGRNPVTGLRREIARLKDVIARQAEEPEELRAGTERLRPARETHAKARFGSGGERKGRSGSGRRRGRQAGRPGHGRTPRPETERRPGIHDPPEAARTCPCCGQPCAINGGHESGAVGTGARAHVRTVRRSRRRRTCGCAPAPKEAAARPAARLFPGTACGTGFLACFLFGRCACHRPLDRAAAWMRGPMAFG